MKKFYFLLLFILVFLPTFASAETFAVKVDTGSNAINTLAATIKLPANILSADINDGGSVLLIWIKPPTFDPITHTISFAGLTPGGFQGVLPILSFTANLNSFNLNSISFANITALANDGKGTAAAVRFSAVASDVPTDTTPPEPFVPSIGKSADIFNGQFFATFLAQDKGTGIDHYDVAYTEFFSPKDSDWQPAESPLLLNSHTLSKKIFIKAVDRAGNARIESVVGPDYYQTLILWFIIIVFFTCVLCYIVRRSA